MPECRLNDDFLRISQRCSNRNGKRFGHAPGQRHCSRFDDYRFAACDSIPGMAQVAEGLHILPVGPVNTYLLETAGGCILIDTGLPGSADKIVTGIRQAGRDVADIRHLILTHAHPDHIGSFAALKKRTQAEVYMHPADAVIATSGKGVPPYEGRTGVEAHNYVQALCAASGCGGACTH